MADVGKPLHLKVMERLRKIEHLTVLGAAIPTSDEVEMMGEERNPVAVFAPDSSAAVAYAALWVEIERRLHPHNRRPRRSSLSHRCPENSQTGEQAAIPAWLATVADPAADRASWSSRPSNLLRDAGGRRRSGGRRRLRWRYLEVRERELGGVHEWDRWRTDASRCAAPPSRYDDRR